MKNFLVLLTLACAAIASPSPWRHGRKHQKFHAKQHRASSSSLTVSSSSLPLSLSSGSASAYGSGVSSGMAVGTSSRPSASVRPTVASTGISSIGTPSGISSRPSASIRPSSSLNSTTLIVPTGAPPRSAGTALYPTITSSAVPSGTPCPDFLRGVNIGGWLLLDSTLNAKMLSAADAKGQWSFDSTDGAAAALDDHWNTYFTEADVQTLKSYGVNAIKIPVGYWAWDNSGTPYKQGADAYLEKAVGWAAAAGIRVWIDVSNIDTSTTTHAEASLDYAMSHSLSILEKIATKYGSAEHASTIVAIQIFSGPIAAPSPDAHDSFTSQAYTTIRKAAANPNLQVIMPDGTSSPRDYVETAQSLSPTKGMFAVAESMSELTCPCEQEMSQVQHIQRACERGYNIAGLNHDQIGIYVGEFNAATNATMSVEGWTEDVVTDVRKYVEANLEVFEAYTQGYFFWSWAVDADEVAGVGWGFKAGIEKGYIPNPLDDYSKRKFPNQCDA